MQATHPQRLRFGFTRVVPVVATTLDATCAVRGLIVTRTVPAEIAAPGPGNAFALLERASSDGMQKTPASTREVAFG
jgi:hypothetical protein